MCSVYGRGLIYNLLFGIEGAPVDGDILEGDVLDPAMGIVVGDVAGDEARLVAREVDILEAHIADAVTGSAVVLLAEEHAEAKECAALYLLDADVLEMDVAQMVLVATAHREYAVAIFVEHVAVGHHHIAQHLATAATVVAMASEVEGVCHIGP